MQIKKKWNILKVSIKLDRKVIKCGDTEIGKQKFRQYKSPILIKNIDINKIALSNKVSSIKKYFRYFIGYKDAKKN